MIYLHNPEDTGSDINNVIVGEPGLSKKYSLKKGETFGFEDEVGEYIIRIYGIEKGDALGKNKGFLQLVESQKKIKPQSIQVKKDDKELWQCNICEYSHEKKVAVAGHIFREHPDKEVSVDIDPEKYKMQEGEKIVPPAEIDRLRRQKQDVQSMRPRRPLADLTPKTEAETGYRNRVDNRDNGLDTDARTASSFYGPGLQEDTSI